ncbi:OsmC family protein [Stakelama pacifica]|uniref:Putative redox protein n=1 Tax=Stakelama pacifica TaxID=517720 RepID=A0A4R6FDH1_9SPHN|nr:OsmC family protein [Stakelama pacifica]TDN79301.1 putative redox protein [Stakelama pacifica]GGO98465.1 osmotically inducible protein C [Stakelama pacifica]
MIDDTSIAPGEVVARSGLDTFATELSTHTHRWVADEPVSVGGSDIGPGPYDLLLAALGSCTVMTMKMVAEREGIPMQSVQIRLRHDRNHAKDCDHCEGPEAKIEAIFRRIMIEGDLTDAQRERMLSIADKCPVHRTLTGTLHVHTVFAERDA